MSSMAASPTEFSKEDESTWREQKAIEGSSKGVKIYTKKI